ncbi:MAG TPA: serine hydrolase domain-containing protein [Longimicrobiales bacterium]|nr:serine hydrolase domain-containing protein [Longimicrobiales bacterium]
MRLHTVEAVASTPAGRVDQLFASWDRPGSPGASVAVERDGRILYEAGFGEAQLEYHVPIEATTIFHVASVSKQFTAFAIAMLAGQGRLSLDDDIRTHLPELPDLGATVTVRHLLHHTSGSRTASARTRGSSERQTSRAMPRARLPARGCRAGVCGICCS